MIPQQWDFMNPMQDGWNMPREWDNSSKSGKVGMSVHMEAKCTRKTKMELITTKSVQILP